MAAGMGTTDMAATMAMASLVNNLVIAEVVIVATAIVATAIVVINMAHSNILLGFILTHTKRWVWHDCSHVLLVH